jgi:lysophospholipase L1-like esterase
MYNNNYEKNINRKIVCIGDSLTNRGLNKNGWINLFQQIYKKSLIINYGYEGYNSNMINNMIPRLIPSSYLFLATILLGTNDCYSSFFVNPQIYKINIMNIIDHIYQLNPNCIVLLITPPPCKLNTYIFEYVEMIYQIGKEHSFVKIVDLHSGSDRIFLEDLEDGVHFSDIGQKKVFNNIQKTLSKYYEFDDLKHLI